MGPLAIITAASLAIPVLTSIYNAWRTHPDQDFAKYLRARQLEQAAAGVRKMEIPQEVHAEYETAMQRARAQAITQEQGMREGWMPPDANVRAAGMAAKDTPMVRAMAAQLGMDPDELAKRFDPTRSTIYVPESKRGNTFQPTPKQIAEQNAGPAQLNPNTGFGQ